MKEALSNNLYESINSHLLNDDSPSEFLNQISKEEEFTRYPFDLLLKLKYTDQSPVHHPEGNVWNHMLLVVNQAAKYKAMSKNPRAFIWAALLHDIGKPSTTRERKGKITSYDHDKVGAKLVKEFLSNFTTDDTFIELVSNLVLYHMQILFVVNDLPFADIRGMIRNSDIEEIALLGLCDRLGRTGANQEKEERNIDLFLQKCKSNRNIKK
ncbi:MAG TPA: HD domain-containing protein [Lachnospiraceae bacterium]|nr:HD domain-containing protein [Lachnospiraceae bacterium]